MEKYINIVLPDKTIDALEFRHNFTISRVGYYEEPRHHYIERADLGDAILLLCIGGSGYVEYKGRKYDIHRGDAALLEPHVPHKYGERDRDPWSVLWVHFRGEGLPGLLSLYKESGVPPVFTWKTTSPPPTKSTASSCCCAAITIPCPSTGPAASCRCSFWTFRTPAPTAPRRTAAIWKKPFTL